MNYISITKCEQRHVVLIELQRPPFNYLNIELLTELADALHQLDGDDDCRAIVIASNGKAFSAGADFNSQGDNAAQETARFYGQAMRMFQTNKPLIAAVHGAAVGAGLGLAVAADFRVTCEEARFSANFNRLGFHPGFGLSLTLPELVGKQAAALLFYTGRRIDGAEAKRIGLADMLVPAEEVRAAALALAEEIAISASIAVEATRKTMRAGFASAVVEINQKELALQSEQYQTSDFREGVLAMSERRAPSFKRC